MNIYLAVILVIIVLKYVLYLIIDTLNVRFARTSLPQEFQGYYDADKYKKSQSYLRERTFFSLIEETVVTLITVVFILAGGFNVLDNFARDFGSGPIVTGLIFGGGLMFAVQLLNLPFSLYHTFVIEEKYGFNRTTVTTFILDLLKGMLLGAVIGGLAFSGILWFFAETGARAWLFCWMALTLFQFLLIFIAPVVIMPLFNKFVPLEDGDLKHTVEEYAYSQDFKIQGVFKMDGSRRSTKSNAFFTGFGSFRRIALFDTLIERHTTDGLVSVLAHEIGHYKKRHILKSMLFSVMTTGLMFYILSFFLYNKELFAAFKMEQVSLYAGLVFFGFLYAPINMVFSIIGNIFSRRHEYEADRFAVTTYGKPQAFILALKKLSVDNLSNLTPHPLKVFFDYSHPPVLERISAIRKIIGTPEDLPKAGAQ
ncbi:MAG: M48 family metallopeptidase [Candidatus Omnitrophica bacterium]|nr:M48 family metallopeptidase [Candidatus Omnitrophota bacterium]MBU4479238.1 M48 family metallopeptidase [Candidatus Omnitrophota bacterium]MCG2703128.1 M48 family metallopeptidase [Candidatus Omnitrophota bacterium]